MTRYDVEVEVIQTFALEIEADSEEQAEEQAMSTYYTNAGILVDEVVNMVTVEEAE